MRALRAAREVDAPDWLIGGEAIRERIWDRLRLASGRARASDVELAFFDASRLAGEREREVHSALVGVAPDICWEATNRAAVHLWYEEVYGVELAPLSSCAEGVVISPETATAVGVRLLADDSLGVVAPYGLEDLFGLVCRRNPRVLTREQFRRRVQTRQIARRWPGVRIVEGAERGH